MKKFLKYLPFIVFGSALIQMALILYKDYTGFVPIQNAVHFSVMLLSGTLVTAFVMASVLFVDQQAIRVFEKRFSWQTAMWQRILLETLSAIGIGVFFGVSLTLVWHLLRPYPEPLGDVCVYNALIVSMTNLILIAVVESILFYRQNRESAHKAERLERENIGMRFETLKKQLDPHFLFNSLNALSSLVRSDAEKAQEFIEKFSSVYRYTLEVIDIPVVTVQEELDFARSYVFLQKIRFEDAVIFEVEMDDAYRRALIPPLAVQTLLENAFKHNVAARSRPLTIRIFGKDGALFVANTLQRKPARVDSQGVGFANLKNRYALISGGQPEVMMTEREYMVKLPLIEPE